LVLLFSDQCGMARREKATDPVFTKCGVKTRCK
jgi:hypothetical protein